MADNPWAGWREFEAEATGALKMGGRNQMGLDTTHDCWHGAYSAFARWRNELARLVGIPLGLMEGYCRWVLDEQDAEHLSRLLPWDDRGMAIREIVRGAVGTTPIPWASLKPDPIHVLLHHSDCDGQIAAEECGPLADRLEQLLPHLPAESDLGHIGDWRAKTRAFIDGLRLAASRGEAVEFH